MWKKIALGVAALVGVFLLVAALSPGEFRIERSATLKAPPEVTFALIDDLHRWKEWSPWEKLDPAMKREYSGAPRGVGAGYSWSGNDQVGSGTMTIVESVPSKRVQLDLHFTAPFEARNVTTFQIAQSDGGSQVTWAMEGENDLMGKAVSLFMDMDAMVGKDFEAGLANLSSLAEGETKAQAKARRLAEEAKAAAQATEASERAAEAKEAESVTDPG